MVVDSIVSVAVENLGESLAEIVARRLRIKEDVEWLRHELEFMRSFLKDAEEKQNVDDRVKQWVSEITDIAYDTMDVLEDLNIYFASKPGFVDQVKKYVCICKKEAYLYGIGNEINSIKKRILDLARKREIYSITSINDAREGPSNMMVREMRRTTSYLEEEQFVGFRDVIKMLSVELLKAENHRFVISIYGTGGLGKTTLARKLYNSADIQRRFTCRAWVCVSQWYKFEDLLRAIIKSFKRQCNKEELEMLEKMDQVDLERYLREFLKEKRYLVVVDDVWRKEDWESLKRAFPDHHNGSRIIITTRKKEVAERVDDRNFVHHLRFLRKDESWDLFEKKIFRRDGHAPWSSPAMQNMGKKMVEKCNGLPLAVVILAGLLSNKRTEEWRQVKEQLWQHLINDSIEITNLLSLSYNDLSSEQKQCFLYFGIYPEDYVIEVEKLMCLWMAEGFITQSDRMEGDAQKCLYELINRSLIQVAHIFLGRITTCEIHDLLRDLAIKKAKEVNLFDIFDPRVYPGRPSSRRQSIHSPIENFLSCDFFSAKLRSLVFFNPDSELPDPENLISIFENYKYLQILDLENFSFSLGRSNHKKLHLLFDSIGNLIHLKFLSLNCEYFEKLPPSVGNLKSLQTLKAKGGSFLGRPPKLPMEISKLINLRHLYIFGCQGLQHIDNLKNLRILAGVSYRDWIDIDTINLVNLQELIVLDIEQLKAGKAYSLISISNLKGLATLNLRSFETFPPLDPLLSCRNLLRLWLSGSIEKLPPLNEFLQSLTALMLERSRLKEDPTPILEKLLNLRELHLNDAYIGKEITCSSNGFEQLEYLTLLNLTNLEKWILAETAMPVIRSLTIKRCPKLETVPDKLKSILVEPESSDVIVLPGNRRLREMFPW